MRAPHTEDVFAGGPTRGRAHLWWLVGLTVLVVAGGMAYCLLWPMIVGHTTLGRDPHGWDQPIDMWVTVQASQHVREGLLSYIYSDSRPPVTLPGFAILLTPFVVLATGLGLSHSAELGGFIFEVPHPTALILLGPVMMACAAVALFGFDNLAATLGASQRRRRLLSLAEAAALSPTIVYWGHPEDVVAAGLCAFALARAIVDPDRASIGWLLGAAIAMQLYAVAVVPIVIGLVGVRRSWPLVMRTAVLPGAVLAALVIPNPGPTLRALTEQITYRGGFLHTTPWVLLSPSVSGGGVAGGPARAIGLAVVVGLGVVASRLRGRPLSIVWLCGLALAMRCVFEPVMLPYYVGPAVGFALVAASLATWRRWAVVCCTCGGLMVQTYVHFGMWTYWLAMVGLIALLFGVSLWYARGSTRVPAPPHAPTADRELRSAFRQDVVGDAPIR